MQESCLRDWWVPREDGQCANEAIWSVIDPVHSLLCSVDWQTVQHEAMGYSIGQRVTQPLRYLTIPERGDISRVALGTDSIAQSAVAGRLWISR